VLAALMLVLLLEGGGVTCSRRRTQNPDIAGPDRAEGTKGIGDRAQELP
jgi:hypothetical protein